MLTKGSRADVESKKARRFKRLRMERSLRESRVPRLGRGRHTRGEPAPKGGVHGSKERDLLVPTAQGQSDERQCVRGRCGPAVGLCQKPGLRRSHSGKRDPEAGGAGASANMAARRQRGEGEGRVEPAARAPVHCPSDRAERSVAALWTAGRGLATRGPLRAAATLSASPPRAPEGPARRGATGRGAAGEPSRARADTPPPPPRLLLPWPATALAPMPGRCRYR